MFILLINRMIMHAITYRVLNNVLGSAGELKIAPSIEL